MDEHAELKSAIQNQVSYTFTTDQITFSKTELKGEKQAYVTGYISVPDVDLYDDVVTMKAMDSMLKQIQDSVITIDYEHEAWRDDNSLLPVAKIVEAKVDDRGLWVKAILNRHSPKFKALWGSIEDGFINAFSIAFKPLKTVEKTLGGTTVRLIDELKLLNVAFTGAPVNQGSNSYRFRNEINYAEGN
jgi:HK97 family phage prohead protease